jgi:pilus assembly protein CpaC
MKVNPSLKVVLAACALVVVGALSPLSGLLSSQALAQASAVAVGDQKLAVEVNEGRLVRLQRPASSVFIANASIADVSVKSPRLIYLFGNRPGETTLYALDSSDNVVANMRVVVEHNMSRLNSALEQLVVDGGIEATSLDGGIVLTGAVASAAEAEDARRLATRFAAKGDDVINRILVTQPNQVNLRVRIAEVSRNVTDQLGFSWDAIFDSDDLFFRITTGTLFLEPGILHEDGALTANSTYSTGDLDLNNLIDALAADGLVTILAEPNLTALSGETASFLAGGEFPVPVPDDDGITIEFVPFGVSLAFTPTVLGDRRISMRVRPEVSELTDSTVTISSITIPGINTRRAETTVELASGQSFAIAGLTLDSRIQNNDDIPGLGNIPLFGALFQQNQFITKESELLIVVTPYVVRPMQTMPPMPTDPYMVAPETAPGTAISSLGGTSQTVPLNGGLASASGGAAQSGFILE